MTGLTRRDALSGSAALIAATAIPAVAHGQVRFGANRGDWQRFTTAIPRAGIVRVWYDTTIPTEWPKRALLADGRPAPVVLSIRPWPRDLLAGRLDKQIEALIRSAPRGSKMNAWHENIPGNPLDYPPEVNNPTVMRRVHAYLHRKCAGTHVRYGSIICGPAEQMPQWIGEGLDWYGVDWYDNPRYWNKDGTIDPARVLHRGHNNLATWQKLSGLRHPPILICESNSPFDWHRRNWFTLQARFMSENNGHSICTFWKASHGRRQGGLSGPWPPSRPVIRRLRYLAASHS